jgi:hypothetical protein
MQQQQLAAGEQRWQHTSVSRLQHVATSATCVLQQQRRQQQVLVEAALELHSSSSSSSGSKTSLLQRCGPSQHSR